jgi:hypothetical protein
MSPVDSPVGRSADSRNRWMPSPSGRISAPKDLRPSLPLSFSDPARPAPADAPGSRISRGQLDAIQAAMCEPDRDLLVFTQRVRLVTGSQLRRIFWPASEPDRESVARIARRRLQRLARWRVIDRISARTAGGRRGGSDSFTWHVGAAGLRLLDRMGFTGKRMATPSDRYVRHTLGVTELIVGLIEADRTHDPELIAWDTEPACWRPFLSPGGARITLKPDAFLRLGAGKLQEDRWFIEVDMATESVATIETKLHRHLAYRASGIELREHDVDPRVLWLVPDGWRAAVISFVIDRLESDEAKLFAVATQAEAVQFLAREARR